jgi:hypothetical protein
MRLLVCFLRGIGILFRVMRVIGEEKSLLHIVVIVAVFSQESDCARGMDSSRKRTDFAVKSNRLDINVDELICRF